MSDTPTATVSPKPPPRATSYLWRLSMLVPALLLAGYGCWRYIDIPAGGTVTKIRLTTKSDLAGQTRDAYESISPGTSDFFLQVQTRGHGTVKTQVYGDTPLGNGLTWTLPSPIDLFDVSKVEVWDYNPVMPNKELDRVELNGQWAAAGQTYQVSLLGSRLTPPSWAMSLIAIGGTVAGVVILKFVWDQAM